MEAPSMNWSAVITGDLVKSSKLPAHQYEKTIQQLEDILCKLGGQTSNFSIYRGDAFQLLLPCATSALSAALLIRLTLIAVGSDCRLSIGIGEVDNPRSQISVSTGQAFVLSGRGLEPLKELHWALHLPIPISAEWQLLLKFSDVLLKQMTARQAQVLYGYFANGQISHQQLADVMQSSRANVTQLLNQANYTLFHELLTQFERYLPEQGRL
jgi:hypothetical protein